MFPSVSGVAVAADLLDEATLDYPVEKHFHGGLTDIREHRQDISFGDWVFI